MSTTEVGRDEATEVENVRTGDMKLEVFVIPVSDADRSKRFDADDTVMAIAGPGH